MIEIKLIDESLKGDINLPNEPFLINGKFVVSLKNGNWSHEILLYSEKDIRQMTFPNEKYDFNDMNNTIFIGAYDENKCVGLCILQQAMFKYMYLYDLKVNCDYRKKHIGKMLIDKAKEVALKEGYKGIYTEAQDNNLGACLFYLKNGFEIGGFDSKLYNFTPQEEKSEIYFYLDIVNDQKSVYFVKIIFWKSLKYRCNRYFFIYLKICCIKLFLMNTKIEVVKIIIVSKTKTIVVKRDKSEFYPLLVICTKVALSIFFLS